MNTNYIKRNFLFLFLSVFIIFQSIRPNFFRLDPTTKKFILFFKNLKNPEPDWSLRSNFLEELTRITKASIFVESGTYIGDTTKNAIPHFDEIHTVELADTLYKQAKKRFQFNYNVHVYHGSSPKIFTQILPNIEEKIIFWLDGHYSGGNTAKGKKNTPIIEELQAIKDSGIQDAVILIDDMRCFDQLPNIPENKSFSGYPNVNKLKEIIKSINPDYKFYIYGDIALAFLKQEPFTVSHVIKACTISRLAENYNAIDQNLIKAEKTIGTAKNIERQTIIELHKMFVHSEQRYGTGKHYRLWYGIILREEKQLKEARKQFIESLNLGLNFGRISSYLQENNSP